MRQRRLFFRVILTLFALFFLFSAVVSVIAVRHLVPWQPITGAWLLLTILFQGPFIIIPLDRGWTLQKIMNGLPQGILLVLIAFSLTNIAIVLLAPLLLSLPGPSEFYDVLPFALLGILMFIVLRSNYQIQERKITIPVAEVSDNWQPFTILHLSDIHAGPFLGPERLQKLVDRFNSRGGFDICVITGDVVNHSAKDMKWVLPILEKIEAPMGIFATIGNHEYIDDEKAIKELYSKSSVQFIFESSVLVSDGRRNIRLIGLDYPFSEFKIAKEEVKRCLTASYLYSPFIPGELQVLLSHHPEGFRGGREMGVPLTLSGHTHGGQVILFGKNVVSPFVHYKRGIYKKNDKYLFVNSGLGNWLPFRVNCPCEYALIKIVKKSAAPA